MLKGKRGSFDEEGGWELWNEDGGADDLKWQRSNSQDRKCGGKKRHILRNNRIII